MYIVSGIIHVDKKQESSASAARSWPSGNLAFGQAAKRSQGLDEMGETIKPLSQHVRSTYIHYGWSSVTRFLQYNTPYHYSQYLPRLRGNIDGGT